MTIVSATPVTPLHPDRHNVFVLHIHHRHGDDYNVYATKRLAQAALAEYCREWWHEVQGAEDPGEDSYGDEAIISAYAIAEEGGRCEEWWVVCSCPIEGAVEGFRALERVVDDVRVAMIFLNAVGADDEQTEMRVRATEMIKKLHDDFAQARVAMPWIADVVDNLPPKPPTVPKRRAIDLSN